LLPSSVSFLYLSNAWFPLANAPSVTAHRRAIDARGMGAQRTDGRIRCAFDDKACWAGDRDGNHDYAHTKSHEREPRVVVPILRREPCSASGSKDETPPGPALISFKHGHAVY
jgi:hypothetical protein